MRKASVISVIVAGVIIIAGIIVCAFGGAYAKKDNFMLFPASENGESVYKYDFTGQEIARISITTEDADVYFKRGGESSIYLKSTISTQITTSCPPKTIS